MSAPEEDIKACSTRTGCRLLYYALLITVVMGFNAAFYLLSRNVYELNARVARLEELCTSEIHDSVSSTRLKRSLGDDEYNNNPTEYHNSADDAGKSVRQSRVVKNFERYDSEVHGSGDSEEGQSVNRPQLRTYQGDETSEITILRPNRHNRNRHKSRFVESLDEQQVNVKYHGKSHNSNKIVAMQVSGDTSKYVLGQHTNFEGNGRMRHLSKTFVDWAPSSWVQKLNLDQYVRFSEGIMTIKESGLYFVYAQIFYLDEHDTNGYRVYKNSEVILQCTTMTHSTSNVMKGNTCYTAGVEYLTEGDNVAVVDLSSGRYSLFEKGKSFFGVIKLSDARLK